MIGHHVHAGSPAPAHGRPGIRRTRCRHAPSQDRRAGVGRQQKPVTSGGKALPADQPTAGGPDRLGPWPETRHIWRESAASRPPAGPDRLGRVRDVTKRRPSGWFVTGCRLSLRVATNPDPPRGFVTFCMLDGECGSRPPASLPYSRPHPSMVSDVRGCGHQRRAVRLPLDRICRAAGLARAQAAQSLDQGHQDRTRHREADHLGPPLDGSGIGGAARRLEGLRPRRGRRRPYPMPRPRWAPARSEAHRPGTPQTARPGAPWRTSGSPPRPAWPRPSAPPTRACRPAQRRPPGCTRVEPSPSSESRTRWVARTLPAAPRTCGRPR